MSSATDTPRPPGQDHGQQPHSCGLNDFRLQQLETKVESLETKTGEIGLTCERIEANTKFLWWAMGIGATANLAILSVVAHALMQILPLIA